MNQFGCPNSRDPRNRMAGKGSAPSVPFPNLKTGQAEQRMGGFVRDEHISVDSNIPGTLSMANIGSPNTGGCQIFFNVAHNHMLDWFTPGESKHAVFGIVTKGVDVVHLISRQPVSGSFPVKPIKMIKVTVLGAPEVTLQKAVPQRSGSGSSSSSSSSTSSRTRRTKQKELLRNLNSLEKKSSRRKRSSSSSSSRAKKGRKDKRRR